METPNIPDTDAGGHHVKGVIFDMAGVIYPKNHDTFVRGLQKPKALNYYWSSLALPCDTLYSDLLVGRWAVSNFFAENQVQNNVVQKLFDHNDDSTVIAQFQRGDIKGDLNLVDKLYSDKCFQLTGIHVDTTGFTCGFINAFLSGEPIREVIRSIVKLRLSGFKTALLTNNVQLADGPLQPLDESLFDVVVQSCIERVRKPDPRIYQLTLDRLQLRASDVVFLDDKVANVESARKMGIRSILVVDPLDALTELEKITGVSLRSNLQSFTS